MIDWNSLPNIDLDDWRSKTECQPFYNKADDTYNIVVESQYETPGAEKDKRLEEARYDGVFKLLKFYGKDASPDILDGIEITKAATVADYFVSYRRCIPMKVLVKITKEKFDSIPDDPSGCDLNKPAEGYFIATLSLDNYRQQIEFVANSLSSYVPAMVYSDNYISNINILKEISRLKKVADALENYIRLNGIPESQSTSAECADNVGNVIEIGFSYNYEALYILIDKKQYTIGYDCFLNNSVLNHQTTINFLLNFSSMTSDLQNRYLDNFNIFDFFQQYLDIAL